MRTTDRTLSEFGQLVYTMMFSHGVQSVLRLEEKLKDAGYPVSRNSIRKYVTGENDATRRFALGLVAVFGLEEEERERLAWAFLFGQGKG